MYAGQQKQGHEPRTFIGKTMWQLGLRYRKNNKTVFGKPDFSFKKYKVAVFVDGEFWHGKDWAIRKADIKSNREFWIAKIERNIQRDAEVTEHLKTEGWTVFRLWGKEVAKNPQMFARKIQETVYGKLSNSRNKSE